MDIFLAEHYLTAYTRRSLPGLRSFLNTELRTARRLGRVPALLVSRFKRMALRGKGFRGALVVLGYEATGGLQSKAIYDASSALELFHTGALIHDDIMDQDDYRRGLPSLHRELGAILSEKADVEAARRFGESMAINTGDLAFYLSWKKLLSSKFSSPRLVKACRLYADFVVRLVLGQALDVSNAFSSNLSEEEILKVYRYKTAEYTGVLPLLLGATLAGMEDGKRLSAIRRFGLHLGWAFQIRDDWLGMFGTQKRTGKPLGSDLREGKATLLFLHLAKHGSLSQKKRLAQLIGKQDLSSKDILVMQRILSEAGSLKFVTHLGQKHVGAGKKLIPKLTANPRLQKLFASFLIFAMERDS